MEEPTLKEEEKCYLAYLIGALADGTIYNNKKHYIYRISYYQKNREYLIECIEPLVMKMFNKRGHLYKDKRKEVYYYTINSKKVYLTIVKAAEKFKEKKERDIPEWIKKGEKEVQTAFVRAFYDTEGSCSINKEKYDYRIRLGQTDRKIIEEINKILTKLGFKTGKILGPYTYKKKAKAYYEIQIHGKEQVKEFYKKIKPIHPEKKKKRKEM